MITTCESAVYARFFAKSTETQDYEVPVARENLQHIEISDYFHTWGRAENGMRRIACLAALHSRRVDIDSIDKNDLGLSERCDYCVVTV